MKHRFSNKIAIGSILAAVALATLPLRAQADDAQAAEITSLKKQIYACHHHKRRHHRVTTCVMPTTKVIEKQTIIEKPVVVEKVVEKQVTVEKPAEKQIILERPIEMERKVVVEHSKHRKHLLHLGIPFIAVNLF